MGLLGWLSGVSLPPGEGSLAWSAPGWAMPLAGALALVALALAARGARRAPPAAPELALLALALAPLVLAAGLPEWVEPAGRVEPGRFVVLVDDSRSMGVQAGGAPRAEAVERALAQVGEGRVEVYRFGQRLRPAPDGAFDQPQTDLGAALDDLSRRHAGERLEGIALVSDGLDRGALRRRFLDEGTTGPLELPGPLSVYAAGAPGQIEDLAVTALESGGFAFIHTPFTLTARVEGPPFAGREVPVTLTRDGQVVSTRPVQLDEAGRGELTFTVTSRQAGRFIYEVSVPVHEGDAVPGNNTMPVAVRVVRDRMRVLQVCGSPSFDQKFLRLFLKQDRGIDLVSFFILRTNEDLNTAYAEHELSLIRFPYEQLFSEELDSFDLVIFQNFDYQAFFGAAADRLLANIAEHVRGGGAFVMIGGDRSFDLGNYAPTELGRALPVRLGLTGPKVDEGRFVPALTEAGRVHPITRLLGDGAENEALWAGLSPLDGLNLSAGANRGSAVLLAHPTLRLPDGGPMPVLAVREVGRGRSMALMSDASWRWVMAEAARGRGNQAYLRFWKNAFRWLLRDPEGERVQVETTRENLLIGDTVRVVVKVRDVGFEPVEGAEVRGEVTGPGVSLPVEGLTDGFGELSLELPVEVKGPWRVRVEATSGGQRLGEGATVFAVTARDPELAELDPDLDFLRALAEAGGGAFYPDGAAGPPLRDPEAGRTVDETRRTPLWSAPALPLWVGVLASLSWWLRRRRGLR